MKNPFYSKARRTLSAKLVQAREESGLTQKQVQKLSGISQSDLSKIENGQRRIEILMLENLAKIYNKPVSYFKTTTPVRSSDQGYTKEEIDILWKEDDPMYPLAPKSKKDARLLVAFGANIKQLRTQHKINQTVLAEKAVIPVSLLRKIERGEVNISISTVSALASALNMPVKELFDF